MRSTLEEAKEEARGILPEIKQEARQEVEDEAALVLKADNRRERSLAKRNRVSKNARAFYVGGGWEEMQKHTPEVARYEQIALDIAARIVRREYKEGDKLYGRSTLAGKYNVSPETIRRAVALLQSMGIVEPKAGRGIIICSRQAAEAFWKEFENRHMLEDLQSRISQLMQERRKLDQLLEEELGRLINYVFKSNTRLQKIEEIEVPEDSSLVGKSLESSRFRSVTGATVLALEREGEEFFSPDGGMPIKGGDILLFVGPPEAKEKVRQLVEKGPEKAADARGQES